MSAQNEPQGVPADQVVSEMLRCGISHALTVPDLYTLSVHAELMRRGNGQIRVISCCSENDAVTMAAGIWIGGGTPILVIQNQGLHAALNSVRAIGLDASMPFTMLVGQFGRERENFGRDPRLSRRPAVYVTEPVLDAYRIPYFRLDSEEDLPAVGEAVRVANTRSIPAAVLVGWPTVWCDEGSLA